MTDFGKIFFLLKSIKLFLMKTFTLRLVIAFSITIIFIGCNSPTKEKFYASSLSGNKEKPKLLENDLRFYINTYTTGLFKINLANEAQIRGNSTETIQLAKAITDFHTHQNLQIEKIAENNMFLLPLDLTEDQKLIWKQLVKEKGWSFDKRFSDLLEQFDTEAVVHEQAIKNSTNRDIKLLAQKTLVQLNHHEKLRQVLIEKIEEKTLAQVTLDELAKNNETPSKLIRKSIK